MNECDCKIKSDHEGQYIEFCQFHKQMQVEISALRDQLAKAIRLRDKYHSKFLIERGRNRRGGQRRNAKSANKRQN